MVGLCLTILILGSYAGTLSLFFILEADRSVDMGSGSRKAGVLEVKRAVDCKYLTTGPLLYTKLRPLMLAALRRTETSN